MTPSILKAQIALYVRQGKSEALRDYLASLRNADFRLAGQILAEKQLWEHLPETNADTMFWHFSAVLVAANNRAYLGTMLKAAIANQNTTPTLEFSTTCTTDIDKKKVLEALLPIQKTPAEVNVMLQMFSFDSPAATENLLFKIGTPVCYFVLFNLLKQYEDRHDYLRRICIELIRKGDKYSFNLACIIKEYFGLAELPSTFSLSLQPYELSRLDANYDTFLSIIRK